MAGIDLENPWILGAILIIIVIVVSVGMEAFLLSGNIREGLLRGIFGGTAFAIVYLFLRSRYSEDAL
ncbi:hypothetical protein [Halohasta salina]|uniref:hypothetical protein n=1 Tax=Halohasta salina TaxID=2961621 RepID=UPI0020A2D865|nr:hypothetical protein [Halohasta salina]